MKSMKFAVSLAYVLSFSGVLADVFPNADGSGELSSKAAWGNPDWFSNTPPCGSDSHDLQLDAAGDFSVLTDVAFGKFIMNIPVKATAVIDCTKTASVRPKVALKGIQGGVAVSSKANTTLQLKGGDWDLNNGDIDYSTYYASGRKIILSDGAVMENVKDINLAKTTLVTNELILTGGSKLSMEGIVKLGAQKDGSYFRVSGGSELYQKGAFYSSVSTARAFSAGRNGLVASGAGTSVSLAMGTVKPLPIASFGDGSAGGELLVSDHAVVKIGGALRLGNRSASTTADKSIGSNTLVRVETGGCLYASGVDLPYGPAHDGTINAIVPGGNRFEVLADGVCTNTSAFNLKQRGNALVVSNGIASVGNFAMSGSDNEIVLQGSHPQIVCTAGSGYGFDITGENQRIRFEVPPEGYDPGVIPLVSDKYIRFAGTSLEITGLEDVLRKMKEDGVGKKTMTLMRQSEGFVGIDTLVEKTAPLLPKGCTLSVEDSQLILTCKIPQGLMLILR